MAIDRLRDGEGLALGLLLGCVGLLGVGLYWLVTGARFILGAFSFDEAVLIPLQEPVPPGGMARMRLLLLPRSPVRLNAARVTIRTEEEEDRGENTRIDTLMEEPGPQRLPLPRQIGRKLEQEISIEIPLKTPLTVETPALKRWTTVNIVLDIPGRPDVLLSTEVQIDRPPLKRSSPA